MYVSDNQKKMQNKYKLLATLFLMLAYDKSFAQYPGKPNCEALKDPSASVACMDKYADCTTPSWLSGADRAACAVEESAKQKGLQDLRLQRLESLLDAKGKSKLKAANAAYDRFVKAECAFEASPVEGGSLYSQNYSACVYFFKEQRLTDYQRLYKNFLADSNR